MSEPFPTGIELALERLTKATTQLARTLSVSDSRHADGQAAILRRIDDVRESMVAVLESVGHSARVVAEVTGQHRLVSVPPVPDKVPWYAALASRFLDAPARSQVAIVLIVAILVFGGWASAIITRLVEAGHGH